MRLGADTDQAKERAGEGCGRWEVTAPKTAPPNAANKARATVEAGPIENVVRDMGPWHGWNPLPGHGHKWMLASHIKLPRACYLIWAWLFDHTLALGAAEATERYGARSPYAVIKRKDGMVDAHLEHIAADLDIHIANMRKYWDMGLEAGVWKGGDGEEGTRRMCLCTEVKKAPEIGPEPPDSGVCTYSWEKLPSYASNDLQKLPLEQQKEFWDEYEIGERVGKLLHNEAVAAVREVIDQDQDNLFRRFGTEKTRLVQKKNGVDPAYLKARAERVAGFQAKLQEYVHTLREFVQSESETLYKVEDILQTDGASLCVPETSRENTERAGGALSTVVPDRVENPPNKARSSGTSKPVAESLVSAPRSQKRNPAATTGPRVLTTEEQEAEDHLFRELRRMQEAFPHTDFSAELLDRANKPDVIVVRRMMDRVRPANVADFLDGVARKFKGLDRNALGKLPARAPGMPSGPRSIALIEVWAKDYAKKLDEAVRATAAEEALARTYEIEGCFQILTDSNMDDNGKRWAEERLRQLGVAAKGAGA